VTETMVRAATRVAGVVVTHGPDPLLPSCLDAISSQVDELVVVANLPDFGAELPPGADVIWNDRPTGFATNANRGIATTTSPWVLLVNPDAVASPGAVERLIAFAEERPRCGIVGPRLVYDDGTWQPSRRRFPTVWGTVVRRSPLRLVLHPTRFSRSHYQLDDQPPAPVRCDWMLGAFLLLRREMLDDIGWLDEAFPLYGEDIDLAYRAWAGGWERWYVPDAVVQHTHHAVTDNRFLTRRTVWHWRGVVRFARKHPETLRPTRRPPR
jgi:N-acetylglucosaminyl-diphospho-decaprenol L-rhamnosyltransferase